MAKQASKDQIKTSFVEKQAIHSIKTYSHVLAQYKAGQEGALKFEGDTPIFLDTNVLLSVYEISFKAREKIRQFIETYKDRIILTSQVQQEFIRNREKIIHAFQNSVTEQLPKSFKADVQNKLTFFKNNNRKKLEDYPEVETSLEKLEKSLEKLYEDICQKVEDKSGIANSLFLDDKFLDQLAELATLPPLDAEQVKTLKTDYDDLLKVHKPAGKPNQSEEDGNIKDAISLTAFPGCGEKGSKEDPVGDFIIFHEIMDYAKDNETDVIFLTNDVKKGDWLRTDGTAHTHYLENFYENTKKMIYILNAERSFETLFSDVSFESLVP
jgi:predicted nucleic acid-binding protein